MNLKNIYLFAFLITALFFSCKQNSSTNNQSEIRNNEVDLYESISQQYEILYDSVQQKKDSKYFLPRSIKNGQIRYAEAYDWTSGFYPGAMWYLYDLTGKNLWKERALEYTKKLDSVQYLKSIHDVGFMIECSYGNAIKFDNKQGYDSIIVQTAKSLATRYRPKAGIIQSWEPILHFEEGEWSCPVIIDNMMNLELLFHATEISKDSTYYNIAVSHANQTLKNHFRADYSSYHVVDYNTETGEVIKKSTHQGSADESAWARGQAWGVYGYTVMYRETKNPIYLEQAKNIASFIKNHPKLPEDQVPYWDYDIEITQDTPKDASAAAITASALLELCNYVDNALKEEYMTWAKTIIESLSSPAYLAEIGTNKGFALMHSTGMFPANSEVDSPINYADYYYFEALSRLKKIDTISSN
ncbi:glycoside hydrolase family 88 protein [Aestuariivivens insulae]|uniref:glycoside hydrolase family 88 protein n=1 Tax=Aestuariivivens insulae TaxID=1621988 RepID=UPI001F59881D|nr:glycoside hydrolase family 88 protein [Aestuariivivens insulae]